MKFKHGTCRFTLVELLIVVAIIAILNAMRAMGVKNL